MRSGGKIVQALEYRKVSFRSSDVLCQCLTPLSSPKHIVFTVFNKQMVKIAYFGVKEDGTVKYHHSFNPEIYLYNFKRLKPTKEVWVTRDMFDCLRLIAGGKQSICNFGLPYISPKQYLLLSKLDKMVFVWSGDKREIAYSSIASLKTFYRFS